MTSITARNVATGVACPHCCIQPRQNVYIRGSVISYRQAPSHREQRTQGRQPRARVAPLRTARDVEPALSLASFDSASYPDEAGDAVVFAVDDTDDAERAVQWVINNFLLPREPLHLVHCVLDSRASFTPVGTTATGRVFADITELQERRTPEYQEYYRRIQAAAREVVERRCVKSLKGTDVQYEVKLPICAGSRSAAIIGETICGEAGASGRVLVIANHGPGLLAEYGSVARYCCQHSPVPVMLVPAGQPPESASPEGKQVIVVVGSQEELDVTSSWAATGLLRNGDSLRIVRVRGDGEQQLQLPQSVRESLSDKGVTNVQFETVGDAAAEPTAAAQQICDLAAANPVRAVLLVNYASKGLVAEATKGAVTTHVSRNSRKPVILLQAP